jgi:5'-nucleotidase
MLDHEGNRADGRVTCCTGMMRVVWLFTVSMLGACSSNRATPDASDAGNGGEEVQILSVSSLLGQLDPYVEIDDAGAEHDFGGLAVLSSYFAADRTIQPNTVLFAAGNSFGASPPLSAQFGDVPTIKALGFLGTSADSLSDHNFDNGIAYLQPLMAEASYPYVSSNVNGVQTIVSAKVQVPFTIVKAGALKIGVLGLTDPNAPNITAAGSFGALTIREPVAATNAAAAQARAAGAQIVVALSDYRAVGGGDGGMHSGPLIDYAAGLAGVDVVLGENDLDPATSIVNGTRVVENAWRGLTYSKTLVRVADGGAVSATATVVSTPVGNVTPDPNALALLTPYRAQLGTLFDSKVDVVDAQLPFESTLLTAETALGDIVAEAFLAKYASAGAQIAVVNGGGIRDGFPSAYLPSDTTLRRPATGYAQGPPYDLVVGDAYTVYPFSDLCVVRTITGAILWRMLEASVFDEPTASDGFLQVAGFQFTYELSAPAGARVQSVTLADGTAISRDDTSSLTLVVSDYINGGGDDYGMLIETIPTKGRDLAQQVLLDYLRTAPPLSTTAAGNITQTP